MSFQAFGLNFLVLLVSVPVLVYVCLSLTCSRYSSPTSYVFIMMSPHFSVCCSRPPLIPINSEKEICSKFVIWYAFSFPNWPHSNKLLMSSSVNSSASFGLEPCPWDLRKVNFAFMVLFMQGKLKFCIDIMRISFIP